MTTFIVLSTCECMYIYVSVEEEAIILITSQEPLKELPTSANCTISCQQTTDGERLYLHIIHLFMRSGQKSRNRGLSTKSIARTVQQ